MQKHISFSTICPVILIEEIVIRNVRTTQDPGMRTEPEHPPYLCDSQKTVVIVHSRCLETLPKNKIHSARAARHPPRYFDSNLSESRSVARTIDANHGRENLLP